MTVEDLWVQTANRCLGRKDWIGSPFFDLQYHLYTRLTATAWSQPYTCRIIWGALNLLVAGPSSIFFFIWTAFDTRPPFYPPGVLSILPIEQGAQSEGPITWSVLRQMIYNLTLVLAWGNNGGPTYSLLVCQPKLFESPTISSARLIIFFSSVDLWSHINVSYRLLPMSHQLCHWMSVSLFLIIWSITILVATQMDLLDFIGLAQLMRDGYKTESGDGTQTNVKLRTSGLFGLVRHPMYFFTLLAFVVTPYFSLDRMVLFIGSIVYLYFAVPYEEEKLISIFGRQQYEDYRKRVPAIFPTTKTIQNLMFR
ncbi:hypothetical protein PROFUN_06797 [Planoprotostelium fungivorum]|uniref:Nuclear envelope membrane protein n=1 Tax=Planoprotostelium fungivorum TaxID=1890364 RepID=A0A2P6NNN1_9EUKA|nr:hypothetical protein PROFUN_06797 [Planoprotostelium fungivorum]